MRIPAAQLLSYILMLNEVLYGVAGVFLYCVLVSEACHLTSD